MFNDDDIKIKTDELIMYRDCLRQFLGKKNIFNTDEFAYIPEERVIYGHIIFKLKDTYGLPLMSTLILAMEDKKFVEWPSYIYKALEHGQKLERVCAQIAEAVSDCGYYRYIQKDFADTSPWWCPFCHETYPNKELVRTHENMSCPKCKKILGTYSYPRFFEQTDFSTI